MVDLLRLDVGAVQSLLDDDGAQLSGGDIGEGAAELANGSTAGAGDDDLFISSLLKFSLWMDY